LLAAACGSRVLPRDAPGGYYYLSAIEENYVAAFNSPW
jgi:hypothetical protein